MVNFTAPDLPLTGLRVLDCSAGALGTAGRILGELGADVVRLDPPGGAPDRLEGQRAGGVGLSFAAANLGKHTATVDLATPAGQALLDRLAGQADILIETSRPGSPEALALDAPGLHRRHPGLVVLSLPAFGEGAMAGWCASDGVLHALSSLLARSGVPGRTPRLPPGELAHQCAATHAACVALIGYINRLRNGVGDHIEVAALDAAAQSLDPGYGIAGTASAGIAISASPRGRPDSSMRYPVLRCRDGFVRFCILAPRQWQGMFEWMGRPEQFADPKMADLRVRFANKDLLPAMGRFLADKTRSQLEAEARDYGVPVTALLSYEEVVASDHMQAREAVVEVQLAPEVSASFPNGTSLIDGHRAGVKGPPAPFEGDAAAVLARWSAERPAFRAIQPGADPARPLAGLRVLDLGIIVVGGEQGRIFADFGAEVIKVENRAFLDGSRAASAEPMPATFAAGHRNKRSLGLNLRSAEGRELLLQMVERADVVLANFKPGTLASLGIGPEVLLARNPRLVLSESSAYGDTGPWGGRMGYGPLVRSTVGLTLDWRYPDDPESFCDAVTTYPDHIAARIGVAGALALLVRRYREDRGGRASSSQAEVMLSHFGPEIAALSLAAKGKAPDGAPAVLDGVFPCAGDDEWCVIAVEQDSWPALCRVIGRQDLAADPGLAAPEGRHARRAEIDEAIAGWTSAVAPQDVMQRMQAAGVAAGMMLRVSDLLEFPYFAERQMFEPLHQTWRDQPVMVDNLPARSPLLARPPLAPAPLLGEQTAAVVREVLGFSDGEIDRLVEQGVLEQMAPAPQAA